LFGWGSENVLLNPNPHAGAGMQQLGKPVRYWDGITSLG
jgi:hypothetical protein